MSGRAQASNSPTFQRIGLRIVALLLLPLALSLGAAAQPAPGFGRFSGVRVDVGPMIAVNGGPQAEALRGDLVEALRKTFADRIGPGGPTLVVRIKSLSMRPYVGGGSGRFGGGGGMQSDYLDGEAVLVGRRGEILARHPQLSALPASYGGAWYDPDSERRRITAIAEHYAGWLARQLPAN